MPVQEAKEATTSTEFLKWSVFISRRKWQEHSKADHYMAQLTAEVHRFRMGFFSKSPRVIKDEEFLLKAEKTVAKADRPTEASEPIKHATVERTMRSGRKDEDGKEEEPIAGQTRRPGAVEVGPDAVQEPKWKRVNEAAKALWMGRVEPKKRTE